MKKNYVTMRDIAQKLGLSRSAVSFVLNDRFDGIRISDEVRLKIKKTAQEMGYCRNAVVQSLVSGRTQHIAFLTRSKSSYEYQSRVMNGFIDGLTKKHYSIQFFYTENEKIEDLIIHSDGRTILLSYSLSGMRVIIPSAAKL